MAERDMERLGVDLDREGAVMSRTQLEESRRRKGECLTCGRKCFRKKIFRMEPITDHGRVLNGRCLNCRPLEVATAQTVLPAVSRAATEEDMVRFNASSNSSGRQLEDGRPRSRRPGSITQGSRARTTGTYDISGSAGRSGNTFGRASGNRSSNSSLQPVPQNGAVSQPLGPDRNLNRSSTVGGAPGETSDNAFGSIVAVAAAQQLQSAYRARHPLEEQQQTEEEPPTPASASSSSSNIEQRQRHPASLSDGNLGGQARFTEEANPRDSDRSLGSGRSGRSGRSAGSQDWAAHRHPREARSLHDLSAPQSDEHDVPPRPKSMHQMSFHDESSARSGSSDADGGTGSDSASGSNRQLPVGSNRSLSHSASIEDGADSGRHRRGPSSSGPGSAGEYDNGYSQAYPSGSGRSVRSAQNSDQAILQTLQSPDVAHTDVLQVLRSTQSSANLQQEALKVLSNMQLTPQQQADVIAQRGVDYIIRAMKTHSHDAGVQLSACRALWNFSSTPEQQMSIADAGGIEAVISAMSESQNNSSVQEKAMAVLSNLAALETNQIRIADCGGVTSIVTAMNKNSENVNVQDKGCAVLTNLASGDSSVKSAISEAGGADAIVIAMSLHPEDVELQEKALRALRNLCANDENNKTLIANVGGIDAVIYAMQVHRDEAKIQEAGAWTLSNLAVVADNKVTIGESGGIDVIVRAMWVHATDAGVQEWGCRALWTLSVNPHNKALTVEVGGISAVVNAMAGHVGVATVQEKGCGVLSNLAANSDQIKLKIVEEEALDAIVMAMVLHGDNAVVQQRACSVLKKLAYGPNLQPMHAANVGALMTTAAEKFPDKCRRDTDFVLALFEQTPAKFD